MVTVIKSHPSERDWQIDILGLSDLGVDVLKDGESNDDFVDRMTVFNIMQLAIVAATDTMEKMSHCLVRTIGSTIRISDIDDRSWTLLCSFIAQIKLLSGVYPEYVELKEQA